MGVAVAPFAFSARLANAAQLPDLHGADTDSAALDSLITPTDRFFIRNHFFPRGLPLDQWTLTLTGCLRAPRAFTYPEILRLPRRQVTVTVECAGNGVGGGAVGTATWTGISLRDLLRTAQLDASARFIRLIGADSGSADLSGPKISYARSVPVDKALESNTLLAYEMNGAPLSAHHGNPLRAIVPGWYGMDSVKWLTAIEALDHEDFSHFMTERYVASRLLAIGTERRPLSGIQVKSQITRPREGDRVRGQTAIHGLAWAGESRVVSVEVTWDGGKRWEPAVLHGPSQPYAWVSWDCPWTPPAPGHYTISARASDARGRTQPALKDEFRFDEYENNWYHAVHCEVL